jgi:hypothetical protein
MRSGPAAGMAVTTATTSRAPGGPNSGGVPGEAVPRMSWAGDLLTLVLTLWLVGGLFLDGWAHNTRPQLETFFTPWHAVFYSGFAATAAWVCWSVWVRRGIPAGYGLALAGLVIFLLSGVGDLAWHLAFGIERDVAALLSPTHLGLFCGGFLIITAPLRSQWADPDPALSPSRRVSLARLLPAVGSVALSGCLAAFIFMYLHPIKENIVSVAHHADLRAGFTVLQFVDVSRWNIEVGVPGFIFASVFLFGPLLFLARRWRPPAGAVLVVIGVQALLMQALVGFQDAGLAALGLIGAVAVEVLLRLVGPSPSSLPRVRTCFTLAPPLFWGIYFALMGLHDGGLGWKAEIWGGTLVWSGLTLLALTMVMWPPATPAPAATAPGAASAGGAR